MLGTLLLASMVAMQQPDSAPARIQTLLARAESTRTQTSIADAAIILTRARALADRTGDRRLRAATLIELARVRSRTDPADTALALLDAAESLLRPADTAAMAHLRCVRAPLRVAAGRPGAKEDAETGLRLTRSGTDPRLRARCWIAHGAWVYFNIDDPAVSSVPFDSAEALQRAAHDTTGLVQSLLWSGRDHFSFFNNAPARRDFLEVVQLARAAGLVGSEAEAHRMLGSIAMRTGDFALAIFELDSAYVLASRLGDRLELANVLRLQGNVDFGLNRIDEAEAAFLQAAAEAEHLGEVVALATTRGALAWVPAARGDWITTRALVDANLAYMRARGLVSLLPGLRYTEAVVALRLGEIDRAEQLLRASLASATPSEYAARFQIRARLAEIHLRRGNTDAAVEELDRAITHLDSLRSTLGDDGLRTLAFQTSGGKFEEPDYGFATITAELVRRERVADALRLAERRRARELGDRLLQAEVVRTEIGGGAAGPMRKLAAGTMQESGPAVLDDSTALVEFVTGRRGQPTTVFTTTRAGLRAHIVAPIDSAERSIEMFLGALRDGELLRESGERIRSALLDPVLGGLPLGIRRLVIVPDDVLHQLPFDALPQSDGTPLLARFQVAIAPSAAVAARLRARERSTDAVRILALGDPDFSGGAAPRGDGGDTYRSAFAGAGGLSRLPASGAEARSAARFARRSVVRVGAGASETFFKSAALDSFRVLHLATHALVSDWSPARTALALAPGGGEDGFLGPGDLMGLRLKADVVVLSGCRTAGGVVLGGEGVRGLTAPLLEAGARSVVATLWDVRDRGAARMVEGIYQSLAAGRTLSAAVREAKLAAIRRGAGPEEWAAFVLVGDPDVTLPLHSPRRATPMQAGGAAAAALLLLAAYRGRKRSTADKRSPATRVSTLHS